MTGAIVDWPRSRTVAPWCKERHQVTESCTMGTSTNPTMPMTADHRARLAGLSESRRTAR